VVPRPPFIRHKALEKERTHDEESVIGMIKSYHQRVKPHVKNKGMNT